MRKCAPGGFECDMTFKPANLIIASGLDDAQVTYFLLLNCALDLHLGETIRCSVALCFLVGRLRCVFVFSVVVLSLCPCGIHVSLCLTSPVYPMYILFRDRWQLPQGAQVTKSNNK